MSEKPFNETLKLNSTITRAAESLMVDRDFLSTHLRDAIKFLLEKNNVGDNIRPKELNYRLRILGGGGTGPTRSADITASHPESDNELVHLQARATDYRGGNYIDDLNNLPNSTQVIIRKLKPSGTVDDVPVLFHEPEAPTSELIS